MISSRSFCIKGHDLSIVGLYKDGHCSECSRECARQYTIRHREKINKKNKEYYKQHKEEAREYRLMRLYKISLSEYNIMFGSQNGCCSICGKHQAKLKKSLMVDHDHLTNKVRGLLCSTCNILLGNANDSIPILHSAIKYLSKYNLNT